MLRNLKYAVKKLGKNKTYSVLNIAGLSVGFSVVTIIAVFLINEYSKDKSIANYQNIYRLYNSKEKNVALDYTLSNKFLENYPEIEEACAVRTFYGFDVPLSCEDNFTVENKAFLTSNKFFEIFNIKVVKSLSENPLADYQSAVITQSLADKLYPDGEALGKNINMFGFADFFINAVVEDFSDKSLNCNFIIDGNNPIFKSFGQSDNVNTSCHYLVLKPGTDIKALSDKLSSFISEQKPKVEEVALQRLDDIYLYSNDMEYNAHETGNKKMLNIFLAVSLLILMLSVINNTSYELSLQYNNLQNIGIRKSNGAGTSEFLNLFIMDSFLKVFIAFVFSILITLMALPFVNHLFMGALQPSLLLKPVFIVPSIFLIVAVVLVNSSASIYIFSRFDINTFLSGVKSKGSVTFGKSILTVFQLSISIILLASIFIINKQIAFIKHADIGFNKEQLTYVQFPIGTSEDKAKSFKNRIDQFVFVKSASLSNGVPGMINYTGSSNEAKNNPGFSDFEVSELLVDDDFIKTMGIQLLMGRDFRPDENNNVCILNETAFKKYGWDNFEEKKYRGRGDMDVIGATSDFNISSLHTLPVPVCLIFGDNRNDYAQINIQFQKGSTGPMLQSIKKEWDSMFPTLPFNFTFYDQFFDSMYQKEEKAGKILSLFSLLAFIITCVGILGVSFQNSLNRTKEIGIRKVNGAKISELLAMLNRDFIKSVALAFSIATPIAWYSMSQWLESFAYKTALSWWIFALAGIMTLGIALLTVSFQSWKAASRNPIESLRYE